MAQLTVTQGDVNLMKDLIQSGDLDLNERRSMFKAIMGKPTTLDDDKLTIACITTDDDDEEFVTNVQLVERGDYDIVADENNTSAVA